MNKLCNKLMGMLAVTFFIAIMPIVVLATNEKISVVDSKNEENKQEYIIYLDGYTDKEFKYAFTTMQNPSEMDLIYVNSILDLGENQVALLDANTYEKLSGKTIYIWAKDKEENFILKGIELDFNNSLTKEQINSIENLTKTISTKITDKQSETSEVRNEVVEGIQEIAATGYVKITDDSDAKYYYERVKTSDSEEYKKLYELAQKIKDEYDKLDMYQKIQLDEKFYSLYTKILDNAKWEEVQNMTIEQPESSVAGEQYVVLLKQVNGDEVVTTDAQFLTTYEDYKPNVVKEQKVTQETAKLPITYDSIALIVILVIIVAALVVVYIRMKKINQKDEK